MVEIKVTGSTPLEALSSLAAFGMHCMQDPDVYAAVSRILEAEKHEEKKLVAAQAKATLVEAPNGATQSPHKDPVQEPIDHTPQDLPTPTEPSAGPAGGENGQSAAPGKDLSLRPAPTAEQVRAKGIEASRKYGKEAVVALLQKFGASGMSALAEKDRAAFLAELERLGDGNA